MEKRLRHEKGPCLSLDMGLFRAFSLFKIGVTFLAAVACLSGVMIQANGTRMTLVRLVAAKLAFSVAAAICCGCFLVGFVVGFVENKANAIDTVAAVRRRVIPFAVEDMPQMTIAISA